MNTSLFGSSSDCSFHLPVLPMWLYKRGRSSQRIHNTEHPLPLCSRSFSVILFIVSNEQCVPRNCEGNVLTFLVFASESKVDEATVDIGLSLHLQ
jgi:hypothetical protein